MPLFCFAGAVAAPFAQAAGAVDVLFLTKLLGPWTSSFVSLSEPWPLPLLKPAGPWVYITHDPALVPVSRRHNKLS